MMREKSANLLFIDDDPNLLASLRRSLIQRQHEWSMTFVDTPREALERFSACRPDVVISDQHMPEKSGLEMIATMQQRAAWPVEYLLLTGSDDFSIALEAINSARVFRFLTKPCSTDDLIASIEAALKQGRARVTPENTLETAGTIDLAGAALDTFAAAVLVLDRNARLIYANQSAMTLLGEKNGLTLDRGGICRARNSDETARLHDLVEAGCDDLRGDTKFMSLRRTDSVRDLSLAFTSTSRDSPGHVIAVVVDPETMPLPPPATLVDLLNLTQAEARIAHTIASGESLESAAQSGDITVSSARTYLKRIYSKTGVNRQADLARLVLTSPLSLMKRSSSF